MYISLPYDVWMGLVVLLVLEGGCISLPIDVLVGLVVFVVLEGVYIHALWWCCWCWRRVYISLPYDVLVDVFGCMGPCLMMCWRGWWVGGGSVGGVRGGVYPCLMLLLVGVVGGCISLPYDVGGVGGGVLGDVAS